MRHCGDGQDSPWPHRYIHRKLARACRKVLLNEDDLGGKSGLALPSENSDSIVPKEDKTKVLKQVLSNCNLPKSFASPGNPAIRCTGIDSNPTRSLIIKTFPRKSVRIAFNVDESKASGGYALSENSPAMNEAAVWIKLGVDPYFERLAVQMLETMNLMWRVKGEKRTGVWPANKAGECTTTYRIISQVFDEQRREGAAVARQAQGQKRKTQA